MDLCVSQLAWSSDKNEFFFDYIKKQNINKIECIFNKIINNKNYGDNHFINFKKMTDRFDLEIYSSQSLFFGINCNNFEDPAFLQHLGIIIEKSKILSLKVLVLGSPLIRKKLDNTNKVSDIFFKLDEILKNTEIELSIEPNTRGYGGDFFYTTNEINDFIIKNNFSNIKTMIDTHNLESENLDICEEFKLYKENINHIHISEKKLQPIINFEKYEKFMSLLKKKNYNKTITLEIVESENTLNSINNFSKILNLEI